jgi:hypothetical protein
MGLPLLISCNLRADLSTRILSTVCPARTGCDDGAGWDLVFIDGFAVYGDDNRSLAQRQMTDRGQATNALERYP